jgi:hypothetical protein
VVERSSNAASWGRRRRHENGLETGAGAPFSSQSIRWVRHRAGLKSLKQRLRAAGWLTTQELSAKLGVHYSTLKEWRRRGFIHAAQR